METKLFGKIWIAVGLISIVLLIWSFIKIAGMNCGLDFYGWCGVVKGVGIILTPLFFIIFCLPIFIIAISFSKGNLKFRKFFIGLLIALTLVFISAAIFISDWIFTLVVLVGIIVFIASIKFLWCIKED